MKLEITDRIAIVTGASQGIGREVSLLLAEAGAKVVLAARNADGLAETARQIAANGGTSSEVVTDVTDETSVRDMAKKALDAFGTIDILINNSGIAGPTADCENVTLEDWEDCMAVNVRGPFLCAKAVLPTMKAQRWGRIVNLSSITGKRPLLQRTAYAASKMAVMGFTRTLAFEAGAYDITVNTVCPGAVEGDRINRVLQAAAENQGKTVEEISTRFTELSALKRMVTEKDIADIVLFLCSDSGKNITAQDISVCAGSTWY